MIKIYLAKSNQANPDYIIQFKHYMKDYDVEIKEFRGGKYDNKEQFKDVEFLFVIGPSRTEIGFVGKGLYSQIKYALNHELPSFFVFDNLRFHQIKKLSKYDKSDWYTKYGRFQVYSASSSMSTILPINIKVKDFNF